MGQIFDVTIDAKGSCIQLCIEENLTQRFYFSKI